MQVTNIRVAQRINESVSVTISINSYEDLFALQNAINERVDFIKTRINDL